MTAVSYTTEGELVSKKSYENTNCFQIQLENNKTFEVMKLIQSAVIPTKATLDSIGYDIYASNNTQVPVNDNKLINTGLAMKPPKGTYIRIAPRSGLALKHKIQVDAGVVDPDYTGELKVLLSNRDTKPFQVKTGNKIAQVILESAETPPIKVVNYLKLTTRGDKGFGSTSQVEAQANICDTNNENILCLKTQIFKQSQNKLIVLPRIMERPPGCSFIGTTPTTALVNLGSINGPTTKIIIDSGSDITLVSPETLSKMPNPPKKHQGKQVKLSQVTTKITISGYVDLPLIFPTSQGLIQTNVEAYVVNGMTTPLILGNNFADQYSLSIIRDNGESILKFADTGRTMKLENSVSGSHIPDKVKTFLVRVKKNRHKINNKE